MRLEAVGAGLYIECMIASASTSESVKERWRTAGRFAGVLECQVKARQNPFAARLVSWFETLRSLSWR